MISLSPLQINRLKFEPRIPCFLENIKTLGCHIESRAGLADPSIGSQFPKTSGQPILTFSTSSKCENKPLRVGVVLSGGQAPGGHNVIAGLFDALRKLNNNSVLIGFLGGPAGIIKNNSIPLNVEIIDQYRNQGGFDIIGSGRTKIETAEQFAAAAKTVESLDLDGLVIVGGDDSNTNAAFLAEFFIQKNLKTRVIGVPKTIDGDLKGGGIEISFGFDTASKTYSEIIGNILTDMLSAKKYTFFIKLMGRSASHITLECALQTGVNLALISEEIELKGHTLSHIVNRIADMVAARFDIGKAYSAILIPEGLIEFIPEFKTLIREINKLTAEGISDFAGIQSQLSEESRNCLVELPKLLQQQLVMDRDPHGNVQVSKIETERLLIQLVEDNLKKRGFTGSFNPQPLFCGYEGRSALPSNFDCQYCYALGHMAAVLINQAKTGYICALQNLASDVKEWKGLALPITALLGLEERGGKSRTVIRKALVDLTGKPFREFEQLRNEWLLHDCYRNPGPIQFGGPKDITDSITMTLSYESLS